jgi:DNA polymerase-3 subunit delta
MDYNGIIRDIRAGKVAPLYLITGEEPYYIDCICEVLERELLDESEKAFSLTIAYGKDTDMDQLLGLARSYPMIGQRQVVVVREAQEMDAFKKSSKLEGFNAYIANPQLSTVLVLAFKHKKPDARQSWVKAIEKKGVVFSGKALYDSQVPAWVEKFVKERGFTITPDVASLIADHLGNKLGHVANELDKLSIILPKGSKIDAAAVEKHIGVSKDFNVFELQNALGRKDILKANRILQYFAANPKENPPIVIVSTIFGYFTKVALAHACPQDKLVETLKINPFFAKDYQGAKSRYTRDKIIRIFGYLRDADRKLKGVGNKSIGDEFILKELVYKILH